MGYMTYLFQLISTPLLICGPMLRVRFYCNISISERILNEIVALLYCSALRQVHCAYYTVDARAITVNS